MNHISARLISILVHAGISIAAIAIAACFLCIAAYCYLSSLISAPLAALCVAVVALIIGLIALALAKRSARHLTASLRPTPDGQGGMGAELGQVFGARLQDQLRRNPRSILLPLAAGGLALGLSSRLRRQIMHFLFR